MKINQSLEARLEQLESLVFNSVVNQRDIKKLKNKSSRRRKKKTESEWAGL